MRPAARGLRQACCPTGGGGCSKARFRPSKPTRMSSPPADRPGSCLFDQPDLLSCLSFRALALASLSSSAVPRLPRSHRVCRLQGRRIVCWSTRSRSHRLCRAGYHAPHRRPTVSSTTTPSRCLALIASVVSKAAALIVCWSTRGRSHRLCRASYRGPMRTRRQPRGAPSAAKCGVGHAGQRENRVV